MGITRWPQRPPVIFATVGSTQFPALISLLLSNAFLQTLPSGSKLTIQYGKSDLAEILTSSADNALIEPSSATSTAVHHDSAFKVDRGSEYVPEPGLRASRQQGLTWKRHHMAHLDPGKTGTIEGWQIIPSPSDYEKDSSEGETRRRKGSPAHAVDPSPSSSHGPNVSFTSFPRAIRFTTSAPHSVSVELIDFVDDINTQIEAADVVVAHAGSGTILETLRLPHPPRLILVPNTSLMDNHQAELADAIAKGNWANVASVTLTSAAENGTKRSGSDRSSLTEVLTNVLASLGGNQNATSLPTPFPPHKPNRFSDLINGVMGFT